LSFRSIRQLPEKNWNPTPKFFAGFRVSHGDAFGKVRNGSELIEKITTSDERLIADCKLLLDYISYNLHFIYGKIISTPRE
jgi:hypothetical protein